MTITVRPRDMSRYEFYVVGGPLGNTVTFAVREDRVQSCHIDRQERLGIHLMIWGDFGPWEHYWSHAGGLEHRWWSWLEKLDFDYLMKKLTERGWFMEFDFEASKARILSEIIRLRRSLDLDADEAREAYDRIAGLEKVSQEMFIREVGELEYAPFRYGPKSSHKERVFDDFYEMYLDRVAPRAEFFWKEVWRPFIEKAKRTEGFKQPDPAEVQHVAEEIA